jgi:hypothetical protein
MSEQSNNQPANHIPPALYCTFFFFFFFFVFLFFLMKNKWKSTDVMCENKGKSQNDNECHHRLRLNTLRCSSCCSCSMLFCQNKIRIVIMGVIVSCRDTAAVVCDDDARAQQQQQQQAPTRSWRQHSDDDGQLDWSMQEWKWGTTVTSGHHQLDDRIFSLSNILPLINILAARVHQAMETGNAADRWEREDTLSRRVLSTVRKKTLNTTLFFYVLFIVELCFVEEPITVDLDLETSAAHVLYCTVLGDVTRPPGQWEMTLTIARFISSSDCSISPA